jgi:hypothetical protein
LTIATHRNKLKSGYSLKKLITPKPQPFRALFFLFLILVISNPVRSQKSHVDSLIQLVESHPQNDSLKIQWMHRISYFLSETDVARSFAYYEKVLNLSDSLHFTYGKGLASLNLALLLSTEGNFESSNKAYFKAIEFSKACGARRLESVALNNIGENFYSLKDYDKCRRYARQAAEINFSLKAWRGVAVNYEIISRCDLEENNYINAKKNLDIGMPYATLTNDNYVFSQFYLGYGKLQAIANRDDSAMFYFNKAIAAARQNGGIRNEFEVYLAQARYMKHLPVHEKTALLYKALMLAEQTHYQEGRAVAANQLSSAYDELKNKDSSVFFYKMFKSIRDSIFSENSRQDVIVNEAEWTMKKNELENNTLKELTTAQKKQIAFKNILLLLGGVGFLLAIFIAFLLYKSFQTKKLKEESQYKQKIAETEMQALQAQMNPHFFFNSLNSIENFIMQNEKKLASDYLNKFARFIRSILDSSNNDLIELSKDLSSLQLYIDLEQLRFNNKFAYCCKVDPQLQEGEYYVPALLVQPFLENAINHGIGPSERQDLKICLQVTLKENMISYTIQDNGIGRDQSKVYNQLNKPFHKSVGMKLTQDRINIFNQYPDKSDSVKIIDLFDEDNNPAGTRIEFAIKAITHASAQSYIGR